jgi:HEAT repeat protein
MATPLAGCLIVALAVVAVLVGRLSHTGSPPGVPADEPAPLPEAATDPFDARCPAKVYTFVEYHGEEYLLSPRHSAAARDLVRSLFFRQQEQWNHVVDSVPHWGTDNQITLCDGTSGLGPPVVKLYFSDDLGRGRNGPGPQVTFFLWLGERERKIYRFSLPLEADECARLLRFARGLSSAVDVLADQLTDDAPAVRIRSAGSLRMLGTEAKAATPALLRALSDEDQRVRLEVLGALVAVGGAEDRVVAELAKEFDREGSAGRLESLLVLADRLGVASAPLVPRLAGYLRDRRQTVQVRLWAARALGSVGPPARAAADDLLAALEDPVPEDGNWLDTMMTALGEVGVPREAAPLLLRLATADSTHASDAGQAMSLLAGIPDAPEGTLRALAKELERKHPARRLAAAAALVRLRYKTEDAAAVLRRGLSDPDWMPFAIEHIGGLGSAGVPFLPDLEALEKAKVKDVRDAAAKSIKKIRQSLNNEPGAFPVDRIEIGREPILASVLSQKFGS